MRNPTHVLLVAALLACTPAARAANLVVGPGGSIQDAVDVAMANNDKIDVIAVLPDIYDEAVVIDYSGSNQEFLTIGRADSFRPIITGGITIEDARLVTVFGFEVGSNQGDGKAAIVIEDTTGAAIIDCVVQPGDDGGIDATGTYEVIVESCKVNGMLTHGDDQMGFGVKIVGRACHEIRDTKAKDNATKGLWVEADRTVIRDCKVSGTDEGGENFGILIDGRHNMVKDCTVNANETVGVVAIGVFDIRGNKIRDNEKTGLRLGQDGSTQFHGGVVKNNTISDNRGFGVLIRGDQDGAEIRNNNIDANRGAGIKIEGDGHLIRKNKIKDSRDDSDPGHGVLIESTSDDNCIDDNVFKENDGDAVRVNGDFNYVLNNVAKDGEAFVNGGSTTGNDGRANETSGQNDFE